MMKKITLFMLLFIGLSLNAQTIFYSEDFESDVDGAVLTGVTVLSEDACTLNNPDIFINNSWIGGDFSDAQGIVAQAQSWTDPSCQVDKWLITPVIDLTSAGVGTELTWKAKSWEGPTYPENYDVLLSTTGTNVADFTVLLTTVIAESENWTNHSFDLTPYFGNNVYIAFRLTSTNQSRLLLDDIKVASPPTDDLEFISFDFSEETFPIGYLTSPANFVSFCESDSELVSITVRNNGLNPVTTFTASFDNGSTSATETFTIPSLTTGNTAQVTFTTYANTDTFAGYFIEGSISLVSDQNLDNDTSILTLMVTGSTDTIAIGSPFTTSFEQWPSGPADLLNGWWTSENSNSDNEAFGVVWDTQNGINSDGEFSLGIFGDNTTANAGGNDWAFSPCIYFDQNKVYQITYKSRVGQDANQVPINEQIDFHLCIDNTAASTTQFLGSVFSVDESFSEIKSLSFQPTTSGMYNLGLHKNTSGVSWWYWIDEFSIAIIEVPTAPSITTSWNACDGEATLTFSYDPLTTYSVNWGDGNIETITSGNVTHVYTPGSTYNVEVTASNLAGSTPSSASSLNALALIAPDAIFTLTQTGASVTVSVDNDLSCNTYSWTWGDGTANASGSSASHTYTTTGTYTLELFASNSIGTNLTSEEVVINLDGVDEIDFVNGISVFPNPAIDELNINFELNTVQNVNISLISIDGKVMAETNSNTNIVSETINTSKLSSGLYIVNVRTNEGVYTRNIMVK